MFLNNMIKVLKAPSVSEAKELLIEYLEGFADRVDNDELEFTEAAQIFGVGAIIYMVLNLVVSSII